MSQEKLALKDILAAIDLNAKSVWDEFSDEEKKSVNFWLLNRWVSSVSGTREEAEEAVLKTNYYYNRNWNDLKPGVKGHPKLLWQLLCMSGNTDKIVKHSWIGLQSKKDSKNQYVKVLLKLYPNMKYDDAELLVRLSTKKELDSLVKAHGQDGLDK